MTHHLSKRVAAIRLRQRSPTKWKIGRCYNFQSWMQPIRPLSRILTVPIIRTGLVRTQQRFQRVPKWWKRALTSLVHLFIRRRRLPKRVEHTPLPVKTNQPRAWARQIWSRSSPYPSTNKSLQVTSWSKANSSSRHQSFLPNRWQRKRMCRTWSLSRKCSNNNNNRSQLRMSRTL